MVFWRPNLPVDYCAFHNYSLLKEKGEVRIFPGVPHRTVRGEQRRSCTILLELRSLKVRQNKQRSRLRSPFCGLTVLRPKMS